MTDDSDVYSEKYVALLDILGFSALVELADKHDFLRNYIGNTIRNIRSSLPGQIDASGFRFVQFSDTIVLSAERSNEGLLSVIVGSVVLADRLLNQQLLLRGGISAGRFQHDDDLMFGPALLLAHKHDASGAPPHIALDDSVFEDFAKSAGDVPFAMHRVSDPWDLSPMLHTLLMYAAYNEGGEKRQARLEKTALERAAMIARNASNMDRPPAVRAKWRWFQDYWNRSIEEHGLLARSSSDINYVELAKEHAARFTRK